jgi:hypothetical protein
MTAASKTRAKRTSQPKAPPLAGCGSQVRRGLGIATEWSCGANDVASLGSLSGAENGRKRLHPTPPRLPSILKFGNRSDRPTLDLDQCRTRPTASYLPPSVHSTQSAISRGSSRDELHSYFSGRRGKRPRSVESGFRDRTHCNLLDVDGRRGLGSEARLDSHGVKVPTLSRGSGRSLPKIFI